VGNVSFCRNSGTKTRVVARVRSIYKIEEIPKPIKNHLNAFLGSVKSGQTAFESVLNVAVNYRHDICFLKFYGGHGNEDNKACDEKGVEYVGDTCNYGNSLYHHRHDNYFFKKTFSDSPMSMRI